MEPDKLTNYDSLISTIKEVADALKMKKSQRIGKPWFDGQCHDKRRNVINKLRISPQDARSPESCREHHTERKEYKALLQT
jgi:hypothetical protein